MQFPGPLRRSASEAPISSDSRAASAVAGAGVQQPPLAREAWSGSSADSGRARAAARGALEQFLLLLAWFGGPRL